MPDQDEQGGLMISSVTPTDGARANALAEAMATSDREAFDAVFDAAMDDENRSPYDSMKGLVEALTSSALTHYMDNVNLRASSAEETFEAQLASLKSKEN